MNSERPPILPISTDAHPSQSCPEMRVKNNSSTMIPGLPSPPLSPHHYSNVNGGTNNRSWHANRSNTLPVSMTGELLQESMDDSAAFPSNRNQRLSTSHGHGDSKDSHFSSTARDGFISPSAELPSVVTPNFVSSISSVAQSFQVGESIKEDDDGGEAGVATMLPSQLRRRHESIRLSARIEQQQNQHRQQQSVVMEKLSDQESETSVNVAPDTTIRTIQFDSGRRPSRHVGGHNVNSINTSDSDDDETDTIVASYHSGALVRVKSHSMFESSTFSPHNSSDGGRTSSYMLIPSQQIQLTQGFSSATSSPSSFSAGKIGRPEMPTRDWVKMQSKMQALELEVSHVRRTNLLLNQELDKVNTHLSRLTATHDEVEGDDSGEGWRREYEFLVQQVDWMHRQLQLAHAENARIQNRQGSMDVALHGGAGKSPQYQTEMTQELCAEVKDLAMSLKMWQSAFQQAEEKYRRKCDGERVLKQTLRERETQLSSLVEKLTGYESEFQKSISNFEELMRLSSELEILEGSDNPGNKALIDNTIASSESLTSPRTRARKLQDTAKDPLPSSNSNSNNSSNLNRISDSGMIPQKSAMPGMFPSPQLQWRRESVQNGLNTSAVDVEPTTALTVDQLSVSILSWAALLATYMLS
ncbi:hypothetical protein BGZ98_009786 [Dissophora globulifera]|nr:hypothetical protein BGZ98_009786 [Dissophora globulifera]